MPDSYNKIGDELKMFIQECRWWSLSVSQSTRSPPASIRNASCAFGSIVAGSSQVATQSAALSAAPFSRRDAASTSTGFRMGSVANDTVGWNRRSTGQTYAASSAKV